MNDRNLLEQRSEFLASVYTLNVLGSTRAAADLIIDRIDDLLNDGDFTECDNILKEIDAKQLSESSLVSFLGITAAAAPKLSHRSEFYCRAFAVVASRRGDAAAKTLLSKYEGHHV